MNLRTGKLIYKKKRKLKKKYLIDFDSRIFDYCYYYSVSRFRTKRKKTQFKISRFYFRFFLNEMRRTVVRKKITYPYIKKEEKRVQKIGKYIFEQTPNRFIKNMYLLGLPSLKKIKNNNYMYLPKKIKSKKRKPKNFYPFITKLILITNNKLIKSGEIFKMRHYINDKKLSKSKRKKSKILSKYSKFLGLEYLYENIFSLKKSEKTQRFNSLYVDKNYYFISSNSLNKLRKEKINKYLKTIHIKKKKNTKIGDNLYKKNKFLFLKKNGNFIFLHNNRFDFRKYYFLVFFVYFFSKKKINNNILINHKKKNNKSLYLIKMLIDRIIQKSKKNKKKRYLDNKYDNKAYNFKVKNTYFFIYNLVHGKLNFLLKEKIRKNQIRNLIFLIRNEVQKKIKNKKKAKRMRRNKKRRRRIIERKKKRKRIKKRIRKRKKKRIKKKRERKIIIKNKKKKKKKLKKLIKKLKLKRKIIKVKKNIYKIIEKILKKDIFLFEEIKEYDYFKVFLLYSLISSKKKTLRSTLKYYIYVKNLLFMSNILFLIFKLRKKKKSQKKIKFLNKKKIYLEKNPEAFTLYLKYKYKNKKKLKFTNLKKKDTRSYLFNRTTIMKKKQKKFFRSISDEKYPSLNDLRLPKNYSEKRKLRNFKTIKNRVIKQFLKKRKVKKKRKILKRFKDFNDNFKFMSMFDYLSEKKNFDTEFFLYNNKHFLSYNYTQIKKKKRKVKIIKNLIKKIKSKKKKKFQKIYRSIIYDRNKKSTTIYKQINYKSSNEFRNLLKKRKKLFRFVDKKKKRYPTNYNFKLKKRIPKCTDEVRKEKYKFLYFFKFRSSKKRKIKQKNYTIYTFIRKIFDKKKSFNKPFSLAPHVPRKRKRKKYLNNRLVQLVKFKMFFNNKIKIKKQKKFVRRKIKSLSIYNSRYDIFYRYLHSRIDVILYNLKLFKTIGEIHNIIRKKKIIVNGKKLYDIKYSLKNLDTFKIIFFFLNNNNYEYKDNNMNLSCNHSFYKRFIMNNIFLKNYRNNLFFLLNPIYLHYDYSYNLFHFFSDKIKQDNIKIKDINVNIILNSIKH